MGCLYELSFPNGKRYLGITTVALSRRMTVHWSNARKGRHGAVYNALRKFGPAVRVRPLVIADSRGYLCALEKRAIAAFGTRVPFGYNQTAGGDGVVGRVMSDTQKRALSAARKGVPTGRATMQGRKHTPEARAKISAALKAQHAAGARR